MNKYIVKEMKDFLESNGFEKITINGEVCYIYQGCIYRISYSKSMNAYILESSEDYLCANKGQFEDSDLFFHITDEQIITEFKKCICEYYI